MKSDINAFMAYILISTAINFRAKAIASLADDDLLELYQRTVEWVEAEGWEHDVDAEFALSRRLWDELERRTVSG